MNMFLFKQFLYKKSKFDNSTFKFLCLAHSMSMCPISMLKLNDNCSSRLGGSVIPACKKFIISRQ